MAWQSPHMQSCIGKEAARGGGGLDGGKGKGLRNAEPLRGLKSIEKEISDYSFTAPAETLLIMYLENEKNTSKIGTTEIATQR